MKTTLIYAATTKAQAVRHAPPEALARCVEVACSCCRAPVLAVADTLAKMVNFSQQKQRPLAVLCPACFEQATADATELTIVQYLTPEMTSLLAKHEAEMN